MQRAQRKRGISVSWPVRVKDQETFFLLFKKAEFQQLKHKLLKFSLNALLTIEHSRLDL